MTTKEIVQNIFSGLKLNAECVSTVQVDHITKVYIKLDYSCSIKDIQKNIEEIGLFLQAKATPILSTLMDQGLVLLQYAHDNPPLRKFDDVWNSSLCNNKILPILLGHSDGQILSVDFAEHPHTLIAGSTGSGKSVLLHSIVRSLLKHNVAKLYLIDPKLVELGIYKSKRRVGAVYSKYLDVVEFFKKLYKEMNMRYAYLSAKSLRTFHGVVGMYPIVVIADEIADLILQDKSKELEGLITSIAQKSRACGIFLVLATQRPSVNILTGTIKANFPARIALKTSSKIDSQVILDESGAENLLGRGDALYAFMGKTVRFQGVMCEHL
jgi:S-DNA-T family DNA segregation ATPase FtsK/SpoIIIE